MTVHDVVQRSPAWHALRVGRLTSTDAGDLMATLKYGGEAARRRDLRQRLACERVTGRSAATDYVTTDMQRGLDLESEALARAEDALGRVILPCGFVTHDTLPAGCSPDGIVGDFEGVIEVKCPRSATHLSYLQHRDEVPAEYRWQLIHHLWVTGAQWVEFVSFDDRFPDALQVCRIRYVRNAEELQAYELVVRTFLTQIDRDVEILLGLVPA